MSNRALISAFQDFVSSPTEDNWDAILCILRRHHHCIISDITGTCKPCPFDKLERIDPWCECNDFNRGIQDPGSYPTTSKDMALALMVCIQIIALLEAAEH